MAAMQPARMAIRDPEYLWMVSLCKRTGMSTGTLGKADDSSLSGT
jgi:hypothetical protein